MKPTVAADEMFPEGVGPYMDLEEVPVFTNILLINFHKGGNISSESEPWRHGSKKLAIASSYYCNLVGGPSNLLMDLAANEKAVHADFFNDFEDLFDDDDLK